MASVLRRADLLTLSNLRNDGRKPHEIRRIRIQMGAVAENSGGSAVVEMGLTTVLAMVRGPIECSRRSDEISDRAIIEVQVKTAPFATSGDRRVSNPTTDRRLIEQSHQLKRAMEAAVLLHLYPKSKIEITVWVLADDGGRLPAAINAATLALVDAGIPLKDLVCACSAGLSAADNDTIVDLNRREESSFGGQPAVYLPCAMLPQRDTVVLSQCEARLGSLKQLEEVLDAAMDGCRAVAQHLQAAVREHSASLLTARSGQARILYSFENRIPVKEC
mmetsp:Transcript_5164/g.7476  ORF Transcript_5164/g.7476 Transcript_5164/m.7476 type:complete len:276 (+) Transcript_5164:119-946(+)|eukprot:CAMPEP_0194230548 /NCGR_PEP_ID=MMETSP0156-20130528/44467_1 /TAXON_ID=33649 /ORGANISM="Thalassionema nitzschioides, Strain L26-B" /LENGTH=275 /DNA_ID=CAMNT_0038963139 /DNA_START=110 /DNA_END=937 /DNA_ORIENTATION=-